MVAYNVYLHGKLIDAVYWNARADGGATITASEVKDSLINHDGYDPRIRVCRAKYNRVKTKLLN